MDVSGLFNSNTAFENAYEYTYGKTLSTGANGPDVISRI